MIRIERVSELSHVDTDELGRLAVMLTESFNDRQLDEELVRAIVDSPSHELILARDKLRRPVGMATMSLVLGPVAGRVAYLEDFVVSSEVRGQGVGGRLWRECVAWGREQGASKMEFTSNPRRVAAHGFYEAQGARVRETDVFRLEF